MFLNSVSKYLRQSADPTDPKTCNWAIAILEVVILILFVIISRKVLKTRP